MRPSTGIIHLPLRKRNFRNLLGIIDKMNTNTKNYFEFSQRFSLKFFVVLFLCLMARLIPVRMPNVEPILAATMPISRARGAFVGFSFAVLSILLYDILTGTLGVQTLFTFFAYGILGVWSARYFRTRESSSLNYVRFAIMGTLFFDAFTGLTVGPIFFHQPFFASIIGQIPFTALHLVGNIAFALILSPAIYNFMIKKRKREKVPHINILNPKII